MKDISETLYLDILNSIKLLIHAAGVLHADIRSSNYLYFKCYGRYQLIDFDLSYAMVPNSRCANVVIHIDSEQAKRAPLM